MKIPSSISALFILVILGGCVTQYQWQRDGKIAYEADKRGDYTTALKHFKIIATNRGPRQTDAQIQVAEYYRQGLGVAKNANQVIYWTKKAANSGFPPAYYNLGMAYRYLKKDYPSAMHWFRKAAQRGLKNAHFNIAQMYKNGLGVKRDKSLAKNWFLSAGRAGHRSGYGAARLMEKMIAEESNKTERTLPNISGQNAIGSSISEAKIVCLDLGFKKDTEKFGDCVLKISR
jgi:TPR repeat protein